MAEQRKKKKTKTTMSTVRVLTLPSNSSMSYYPENTTANYKVELPMTLTFDGPHEVALTSFHYNRSWYNFPTTQLFRAFFDPPGTWEADEAEDEDEEEGADADDTTQPSRRVISYVESGHYVGPAQVLRQLNRDMTSDYVSFIYSDVTQKVTVHFKQTGWRVKLSADLGRKLGWGKRITLAPPGRAKIESPNAMILDDIDLLYIHCDMAADSHVVGDKLVPLLKAVSVRGYHGETVSYEPRIIDWLPMRSNSYRTIEILITDGAGVRVPFESGQTLVKLHVRRCSPFSAI